jgi:hypothetical protein
MLKKIQKKLNLKPFDIQKAKEGKPICTKNGKRQELSALTQKVFYQL